MKQVCVLRCEPFCSLWMPADISRAAGVKKGPRGPFFTPAARGAEAHNPTVISLAWQPVPRGVPAFP